MGEQTALHEEEKGVAAGKKVYFLSDLHLGAPHDPRTRDTERRVVRFLEEARRDAEVIFLLGDILDYWYEYRYVVPRGFVRFFGKLAELTDAGIRVVWMIGNHDIWIRDYIPSELGVEVIDGTLTESIFGKHFFMTHGDGVGKMKRSFRILRHIFRNRFCQWLYSGINPRWTIPFAYAWSAHSRKHGCPGGKTLTEEEEKPMLRNLRDFSLQYLKNHPDIDFFIYGHLHLVVDETIAPDCRMVVLGEWIESFTYATFDGTNLELKRYD